MFDEYALAVHQQVDLQQSKIHQNPSLFLIELNQHLFYQQFIKNIAFFQILWKKKWKKKQLVISVFCLSEMKHFSQILYEKDRSVLLKIY